MNVWSISVSISVTITGIWTKFGTQHKYHTINTPESPNSNNLKIQDGGGRHLEYGKNVNNSGLDKGICSKFDEKMHHDHAEMTRDQKSKPEVNSRDVIKRITRALNMCASTFKSANRQLWVSSCFRRIVCAADARSACDSLVLVT